MNPNETQDIIKSRFKELPPEVQKAITATDLPNRFDALSKKYALRIDQSDSLQTETLLVMLGLEKPADFMDNLVKNTELSREIAKQVATDVNTDIIGSIRATLEKLTSDKDEENEESVSPTEPQLPNMPTREEILAEIENPPAFVDRLLSGPTTSVTETVVKNNTSTSPTPSTSSAPTTPSKPRIDPYREPIE